VCFYGSEDWRKEKENFHGKLIVSVSACCVFALEIIVWRANLLANVCIFD
jgi:hypothetical protein